VTFVLIYGAFLSFLPFVLEGRFGATSLGIGLVFAVASVATGLASFFLERLARLRGPETLVLTGFVLYVATMLLMPLAPVLWILLVLVAIFGAANGITIPSILTIVAGSAPDQQRAIFMSVNGTLLRLGQTVGPLLAGAAFAVLGLEWAFWIGALLAVGLLTALVRVSRGPRSG
jgi:MFS family permease